MSKDAGRRNLNVVSPRETRSKYGAVADPEWGGMMGNAPKNLPIWRYFG
jgi:hypothetical protein